MTYWRNQEEESSPQPFHLFFALCLHNNRSIVGAEAKAAESEQRSAKADDNAENEKKGSERGWGEKKGDDKRQIKILLHTFSNLILLLLLEILLLAARVARCLPLTRVCSLAVSYVRNIDWFRESSMLFIRIGYVWIFFSAISRTFLQWFSVCVHSLDLSNSTCCWVEWGEIAFSCS